MRPTGFLIWHTARDERVCPTCGALEGQIFPAAVGIRPPLHPRCRCWVTPYGPEQPPADAPPQNIPDPAPRKGPFDAAGKLDISRAIAMRKRLEAEAEAEAKAKRAQDLPAGVTVVSIDVGTTAADMIRRARERKRLKP